MGFCIVHGFDVNETYNYDRYGEFIVKINEHYAPGILKYKIENKNIKIIYGDIFEKSMEEIMDLDWYNNTDVFDSIVGDFSIINLDFKNNVVYFGNTKSAIENIFIYSIEEKLIISDNFWEVIKIL